MLGVSPLHQEEFLDDLLVVGLFLEELQRFLKDPVHQPALTLAQPDDQGFQLFIIPVFQSPFHRAGDDERGAGLIDKDGVHLVHDGIIQVPLDHVLQAELHVVPQVIEAEFVVGPVGNVAPVGLLTLGVVELVDDDPYGHAQEMVNGTHPGRIPFGQVIVHRDHMDSLAG